MAEEKMNWIQAKLIRRKIKKYRTVFEQQKTWTKEQQEKDKPKIINSILELSEFFDVTNDAGEPLTNENMKEMPYTELLEIFTEMMKMIENQL